MSTKRVIILGATGSIGRQALAIMGQLGGEFQPVALAASSNWHPLAEMADAWGVREVALWNDHAARDLIAARPDLAVRGGPSALSDLVEDVAADIVIVAVSGLAALQPMLAAMAKRVRVAFASKEPLVAAGRTVMDSARRHGAELIPIDSEISAVFQCMHAVRPEYVEKILLTASGGPFVNMTREELAAVTAEQALAHPTWSMGPKVTIDSASLMNKGFEVFELRWLFDVPVAKIEVVVHHQSIVHSAVRLKDSSVLAQMSLPDMQGPIGYALTYPERRLNDLPRLDLAARGQLTFDRPDTELFPCLRLAFEAAEAGATYPAVLNAADEVAVEAFLEGRLGFLDIPEVLARVLEAHDAQPDDLEAVLAADRWARVQAVREVEALGKD